MRFNELPIDIVFCDGLHVGNLSMDGMTAELMPNCRPGGEAKIDDNCPQLA